MRFLLLTKLLTNSKGNLESEPTCQSHHNSPSPQGQGGYLFNQSIRLDLLRFKKCPDVNAESIGEAFQRVHSDISFPALYARNIGAVEFSNIS